MALILVGDEAANAVRRNPPTDKELVRMLNGLDEDTMPTTEQARWLAAFVLTARGHILNRAPKGKNGKEAS